MAGALFIGYSGTPAQAATQFPAPSSSWYWADQIQPLGAVCAPAPAPPDTCVFPLGQANSLPSPDVPAGDIAASARNNSINKVAAVTIDLSTVPENATLANATLRLVEDTTASGNQNQATGATVLATPVDYYAADQDARPIGEAPDMSGQPQVQGVRAMSGTDGVWTFVVTGILNKCLEDFQLSCGVGLRPPTTGGGTFGVVWYGPRNASPTVTNEKKPSVSADVVPGSGTTTTTEAPPDDTFVPDVIPPSSTSSDDTSSTPAFLSVGPAVAPPASAPTTTIPVRRIAGPSVQRASTDRTPPFAFFLAAIGLAGLLGSSMVALGDSGDPVPARQGSVMRTLERMSTAPEDKE